MASLSPTSQPKSQNPASKNLKRFTSSRQTNVFLPNRNPPQICGKNRIRGVERLEVIRMNIHPTFGVTGSNQSQNNFDSTSYNYWNSMASLNSKTSQYVVAPESRKSHGSLPALNGVSVHQLDSDSHRKWWQIKNFFSLRQKQDQSNFRNQGLTTSFVFLITCPLHLAIMIGTALPSVVAEHKEIALLKLVLFTVVAWAILANAFVAVFRRHQRIVHQVIATDDGLEVSSPFFNKKIRWGEIRDAFEVGNPENGYDMLQLDYTGGESIFLSKSLSNSEQLFALIENRLKWTPRMTFQLNHRLSDEIFDMCSLSMTAVAVAVVFTLAGAASLQRLENVAILLVLAVLVGAYKWFCHHKTAQLIRIGKSEIYIQTRNQSKLLNWDQIKGIKRIPILGLTLLKTRNEWLNLGFTRKDKETILVIEDKRRIATGR